MSNKEIIENKLKDDNFSIDSFYSSAEEEKKSASKTTTNKKISYKTTTKSVKVDEETLEKIETIKKALATTKDSDALRWCIEAAWKEHEDKILELASRNKSLSLEI